MLASAWSRPASCVVFLHVLLQKGRSVEGRAQTAEQEITEVKITSAEWILDESLNQSYLVVIFVSCSAANVHACVVFLKQSCAALTGASPPCHHSFVTSCSCHWGLGPFTSSILTRLLLSQSVCLVQWEHWRATKVPLRNQVFWLQNHSRA